MNIEAYNREAWDRQADNGSEWTIPVSAETIAAARQGVWSVLLTENRPVPRNWFPELHGLDILCLAGGGGQQGPTFAAAGANVTVLDTSPQQLERDRLTAERDGLTLTTVQGNMADLSLFADAVFDLVFNPCSNCFAPDVRPIWKEAYRVLRHGGTLLTGFVNPAFYIFDMDKADEGILEVAYPLPYSDLTSMDAAAREHYLATGGPLEFGHTLTDQIAGQTDAGFHLIGFYEDTNRKHPIGRYMPTYIATRAVKP